MSNLKLTVKRQKTGEYTASAAAATTSLQSQPAAAASPTSGTKQAPANSTRKVRPKSIVDYMCSLSATTLTLLYRDPFTVLTIFRSLPPLSKQYVLRLVCLTREDESAAIDKQLMDGWVRTELTSQQSHHQAINRLGQLHILHKRYKPAGGAGGSAKQSDGKKAGKHDSTDDLTITQVAYQLNSAFATQLQLALTNQLPELLLDTTTSSTTATASVNVADLSTYASNRWNQLLHYMVGVRSLPPPPAAVQSHLLTMGLMTKSTESGGSSGKAVITPNGFSFLFKEQHTQVWDVVLAYVGNVSTANGEREEVLTFMFHLAFMRVGKEYSKGRLTGAQRRMVEELSGFGLILMKASTFIPTHLVINLSSSSATSIASNPAAPAASVFSSPLSSASLSGNQSSSSTAPSGYLIVETTFKVYAYTTSAFQVSLLGLFLRFDYQLPDMLVATLTKDSCRRAYINNISARELIGYMEQYAHPCMRAGVGGPGGVSLLPENVVDAMRLWEAERSRMEVSEDEVCLLSEFESEAEYVSILEELRKHDCVVYYNDSKKSIVCTEQGVDVVKAYRQAQAQAKG